MHSGYFLSAKRKGRTIISIDILNIEPHLVSRGLSEKIILFYGQPKIGKTTVATQFPKSLLLAFEKGYSMIGGIKPQKINRWSEFKQVISQLKNPAAQEMYQTIVIDTVDEAYAMCEKFILGKNGVEKLSDIPYGGGYAQVKKEFKEALKEIPMLDYSLVMISHEQIVTTVENGVEVNRITNSLSKAPRLIVNGMVDILGYAKSVGAEGEHKTALFLRSTPAFEAGTRLKFAPAVIKFDYESIKECVTEAIKKEEEDKQQSVVVEEGENVYQEKEPTFEEVKELITLLTQKIAEKTETKEAVAFLNAAIERNLGAGITLKTVTEKQIEPLILLADELERELKNLNQ